MPSDRSNTVICWLVVVIWSCLCLGTVTATPGCSPGAPSSASVHATPVRLKAMLQTGRASTKSKNTKREARPAPRKSHPQ
jgi:hypothetical protein